MAEIIDVQTVCRVAQLARLDLDERTIEAMQRELEKVLEHVTAIQAIDVEGVDPLAHPRQIIHRLADDEVEPSLDVGRALGGGAADGDAEAAKRRRAAQPAPRRLGPFIVVPAPLTPGSAEDADDAGAQAP